jgi:hypothetical protein
MKDYSKYKIRVTDKYVCFLTGPLGNWYRSPMTLFVETENGKEERNFFSSEQYFMYKKAVLFKDWETAERILHCGTSKNAKDLGRQVKGFDSAVWDAHKYNCMYSVILVKYDMCEDMREFMHQPQFAGKEFVECNRSDTVWACGLEMDDDRVLDKSTWRGENLLGQIMTAVRDAHESEENNK